MPPAATLLSRPTPPPCLAGAAPSRFVPGTRHDPATQPQRPDRRRDHHAPPRPASTGLASCPPFRRCPARPARDRPPTVESRTSRRTGRPANRVHSVGERRVGVRNPVIRHAFVCLFKGEPCLPIAQRRHTPRRPCPGTHRDPSGAQPPAVTLPPAFQAFHHLHYERYLEYAQAHLPESTATRAVREAFGYLATHWPYIVSRLNPTSCAWSWFTTRIRIVSRPVLTAVAHANTMLSSSTASSATPSRKPPHSWVNTPAN